MPKKSNLTLIKEIEDSLYSPSTYVWQIKGTAYGSILKYKKNVGAAPLLLKVGRNSEIDKISLHSGISWVFYSEPLSLELYRVFQKGHSYLPYVLYKKIAHSLSYFLNTKTTIEL